MPIYEHLCKSCNYHWEDYFSSYKSPVPSKCPECNKKGRIQWVMSLPAVGRVELNKQDRPAAFKEAQHKLRKEMASKENEKANIVGESAYHNMKLNEKD